MSTTVDDAQQQADLLTELINSLSSAPDPNIIRPQIQTEAFTLHGMELALVGPAELAAQAAAGAELDALINWSAVFDANTRFKVVLAAKSCEPITSLGGRGSAPGRTRQAQSRGRHNPSRRRVHCLTTLRRIGRLPGSSQQHRTSRSQINAIPK